MRDTDAEQPLKTNEPATHLPPALARATRYPLIHRIYHPVDILTLHSARGPMCLVRRSYPSPSKVLRNVRVLETKLLLSHIVVKDLVFVDRALS